MSGCFTRPRCLDSEPERTPEEIKRAIDLGPDEPFRLLEAATITFALGEHRVARSYLDRAYEAAPPDFPLAADLVSLGGLLLAAIGGDPDLAEQALRESAAIDEALQVVKERDRLLLLREQLTEEQRPRSQRRTRRTRR